MRISNLDRVHQLIYISSHSLPSLRKYKWHLGIFPGKMLQRYSVRLQIYSWFMKYCHPKLASAGVIAGDVGRRQQAFLASLPGKAQSEIYRQSCEQNQNWYSLAKQDSVWPVLTCCKTFIPIQSHFWGGRELVSYHLGDHSRQPNQSSHHC